MVTEDPVETLWKRSGVLKLAVSIGVSERAQKSRQTTLVSIGYILELIG